jgi:hypothetical protein
MAAAAHHHRPFSFKPGSPGSFALTVRPIFFDPEFRAVPRLGIREGGGELRKVCLLRKVLSYRDLQYNIDTTGLVPVRYR